MKCNNLYLGDNKVCTIYSGDGKKIKNNISNTSLKCSIINNNNNYTKGLSISSIYLSLYKKNTHIYVLPKKHILSVFAFRFGHLYNTLQLVKYLYINLLQKTIK
uniref:Uncharacterized protein n=1 Tax=Cyanoptyche gloeocystis TaxID=77922 RepID=A0A096Y6U8_9EUKA|nr:hypothetical protein NX25_p35 [Cyanoptyche gloeocystis]AIM52060.1 hypothetical protein [Cyanoptyche gloeocystis]